LPEATSLPTVHLNFTPSNQTPCLNTPSPGIGERIHMLYLRASGLPSVLSSPPVSHLKSRPAGRSSSVSDPQTQYSSSPALVISEYLILLRIYYLENSVLTFSNFFSILPRTEKVSSAIRVTVLLLFTCSFCPARLMLKRKRSSSPALRDAPRTKWSRSLVPLKRKRSSSDNAPYSQRFNNWQFALDLTCPVHCLPCCTGAP
jgi:hypothetical protein